MVIKINGVGKFKERMFLRKTRDKKLSYLAERICYDWLADIHASWVSKIWPMVTPTVLLVGYVAWEGELGVKIPIYRIVEDKREM